MKKAITGIADHCGWAVAVTISSEHIVIDRRRLELLDENLPKLPHHHEAQSMPLHQADLLIEKVKASAVEHSAKSIKEIQRNASVKIVGLALRHFDPIPDDLEECLTNYRIQNVADSVMYRKALAQAAERSGLAVHWYERKTAISRAQDLHPDRNLDEWMNEIKKELGAPWQKDHRLAMAAALVALKS